MTEVDQGRLIGLLERLVAVDSQNPPGREAAMIPLLESQLKDSGFEVAVQEIMPERPNFVATLRHGDGPTFAFNTHTDTVPAGTGWTGSP